MEGYLGKIKIDYREQDLLDISDFNSQYTYSMIENHHDYQPYTMTGLQSYNPIYAKLFDINKSGTNIVLQHKYHIHSLHSIFNTRTGEIVETPIFVKFSPLLDPIKYMIGKYPVQDDKIRKLPLFSPSESSTFPKLADENNASYIDGFFSFLSSQLLEHHGFLHGIDYYGSYLGVQDKFKMNATDDIEYLYTSDYFNRNVGKHFFISDDVRQNITEGFGSRANKNKLTIQSEDLGAEDLGAEELGAEDLGAEDLAKSSDEDNEVIYEKSSNSTQSSTDSSNNSDINYSSSDSASDSESESYDDESESASESEESSIPSSECDNVFAFLPKFPVQMICLEKCVGTFDDLLDKGVIDECEGASALFQIVMTLIVYQRAFSFTHNDLHTNNIMYVNTDIEYLHYMWENRVYRVPTYGKIYKIIDFGRSIYRYEGKTFCSDSFATGGDAATQYNCEPYMNENRPRLDPNPAFDLCRLGCSMYDFLIEDERESDMDDYQKTVARWCKDDNGHNVLYKRNGEERYPNFKLYKMIARIVHHHTPQEQLKFPLFAQFLMPEAERSRFVDGEPGMMNVDAIPSYV